jgi:hypothetical protein
MCSSLCFLSGKYEPEAMNFLEKRVGDLPSLQDSAAVVELAVAAMQHVLSTDFKSSEIEVAVVAAGGKFHLLSEEEVGRPDPSWHSHIIVCVDDIDIASQIDQRLTAIADKSDS